MFTSLLANNSLTASSNLLASHMHLARSEAVKRGTPVTLCPSGDGASCAGTTQWSLGWLVFVDGGTPGQVDADDTVLAISPNVENDVTIKVSQTYVRYRNDGTIDAF
jgi:type IV fimbrial biogenesis protein FimT